MKNTFSKAPAAFLILFLFLGFQITLDMADAAIIIWQCSRCNQTARINEGYRPGPQTMGNCVKGYEQTGHNWVRQGAEHGVAPVDNYLTGPTSGTIGTTSFKYTNLTFTHSSASVRIRNEGLNAHFSAELHMVDSKGAVVMEFGPLEGNIPGWGEVTLVAKPPYPRIHRHEKGSYRDVWLNIKVTPETR